MRPLVVGIGHPDRGDDAAGLLVAQAVAERAGEGVEVAWTHDPLRLPDLWAGREVVVLVDAAVGTGPAGSVRVDDASATALPALAGTATSTHGWSVPAAVELSRRLGTLPPRLVVVSVAGSGFAVGAPASPAVRAAVPAAADAVLGVLHSG